MGLYSPSMRLEMTFYLKLEEKKHFLDDICGDRSINGPVGLRIGSRFLGPWSIRGCAPVRGRYNSRQYAPEDVNIRGRSERILTVIRSQSQVTVKGKSNRLMMEEIRQTNIYHYSCLHINDFSTHPLAALMWRWYLNSKGAALQLPIGSFRRYQMGQKEILRTKPTRVR